MWDKAGNLDDGLENLDVNSRRIILSGLVASIVLLTLVAVFLVTRDNDSSFEIASDASPSTYSDDDTEEASSATRPRTESTQTGSETTLQATTTSSVEDQSTSDNSSNSTGQPAASSSSAEGDSGTSHSEGGHSSGASGSNNQTDAENSGGGHSLPAPIPASDNFQDITSFGVFHNSSSHTHNDSLAGGRTAITTEALVSYNALRSFEGLEELELQTIGQWAFDQGLTNNDDPFGQDLEGAGLYIAMQGAKVGWMKDSGFDAQVVADIQRSAREGDTSVVMSLVEAHGRAGYADFLRDSGLVETFVNTLKMEPHYGGWMHGRMHGGRSFFDSNGSPVATAHDLHHLTVLSHDQTQPFMNDTFDWPQWPALDVPEADVLNYFQSMVTLGAPNGVGLA